MKCPCCNSVPIVSALSLMKFVTWKKIDIAIQESIRYCENKKPNATFTPIITLLIHRFKTFSKFTQSKLEQSCRILQR